MDWPVAASGHHYIDTLVNIKHDHYVTIGHGVNICNGGGHSVDLSVLKSSSLPAPMSDLSEENIKTLYNWRNKCAKPTENFKTIIFTPSSRIYMEMISYLFPDFRSCTTDNSTIARSYFQLLWSKGNVKIALFVKTKRFIHYTDIQNLIFLNMIFCVEIWSFS